MSHSIEYEKQKNQQTPMLVRIKKWLVERVRKIAIARPSPFLVASVFIGILTCGYLFSGAPTIITHGHNWVENTSVMSAEGDFDRVELVVRSSDGGEGQYLGSVNGVEGQMIGTVYCKIDCVRFHGTYNNGLEENKGYYYEEGNNYQFYLYVYSGELHVREVISILGETQEKFVYENVTVVVKLSSRDVSLTYGYDISGIIVAVGCTISVLLFLFRRSGWKW
ncbi:MAG: hypothetical protein ACYTFW_16935 [Planctomycetota bacterium]|jgi:hypothetical protein